MTRTAALPVAAVLALATLASPALAGGGCGHGDRMLQRLDLNGDGRIAQAEISALQQVRFLRWDADGDGAVTEDELVAAAQRRMAERTSKRFARMDGNGDGRIELDEFRAFGAGRFAAWDVDGDGLVSGDELRARQASWRNDPPVRD